jgi:hypothetical protein
MISSLQREILHLALEKRFITCEEILLELWSWKGQEQCVGSRGPRLASSGFESPPRVL